MRRRWQIGGCQVSILGDARPDEDPGLRAAQRTRRNPGVLQGLPRHFQQQTLLRVHLGGFASGDVEEFRVEGVDVGQERSPPRGARQRRRDLGGAVVERRPPIRRHLCRPRTGPRTGTATTLPARRSHRGTGIPDRSPRSARPSCRESGSSTGSASASGSDPLRNRARSSIVGCCQNSTGETVRPSSSDSSPESTTASREPTPRSFIDASKSMSSGLQPIFVTR